MFFHDPHAKIVVLCRKIILSWIHFPNQQASINIHRISNNLLN